ncbi:MAG TPA: S-layer homology domain-containing protein [Casimicrobiaceae bacterium]|nr:S-layer homology domain-containing protein [Casimicrobiaceae bacterium]
MFRLVVVFVAVFLLCGVARADSQGPVRLFGATVADQRQKSADATSLRSRIVSPDVALVERLAREHDKGHATRLTLDLFRGLALEGDVIGSEIRPTGSTLFVKLRDVPLGNAVLTLESGVLTVTVDYPYGSYRLTRNADGVYGLSQRSSQAHLPGLPPRRAPSALPRGTIQSKVVPLDSGRLIDMMVVWTQAAQDAAGGLANMQSQAQAAVDSLNAIFLNSGVANRMRLVHRTWISYVERTGACGDMIECALDDVTNKNDGFADEVHALRDLHGADLVGLIIAPQQFWCGQAWIPQTIDEANEFIGFSVVTQSCAVAGRGFAHEVAHNLGAGHDPAHHDGFGPKPYNVDRIDPQGAWRTIMSYGAACGNCAKIDYFSNPRLQYIDGDDLGTPQANNALVINLTGNATARFRPTSPLHPVPQRFIDVPTTHPFFGHVEFLAQAAITTGCGNGNYCPDDSVTRGQMAVFLERTMRASNFVPPPQSGFFFDVPVGAPFGDHIEKLYVDGVTQGCSTNPLGYCPNLPVTRGQMAVFLLRASCGSSYVPAAPASSQFADVPLSHPFANYIHKLSSLGITSGCATGPLRYCPESPVTRGQMAAFLERSFPYLSPSEACSP